MKLLGLDLVGEQDHLHRARRPDETRQPERPPAVGHEADLHELLLRVRARRRDAQVARERQVGPEADRAAVHHRDRGLVAPNDALHQTVEVVHVDLQVVHHLRVVHEVLAQVGAGAEVAAGPAEDDAADGRVARRLVERAPRQR